MFEKIINATTKHCLVNHIIELTIMFDFKTIRKNHNMKNG
jgi:hypothetical protein